MYQKVFIALFIMSLFVLREIDSAVAKDIEEKTIKYKHGLGVYSLSGIKEVGVLIYKLPKSAIEDGLSEQQLQTDVEIKLRRAGIKVVPEEEIVKRTFPSVLYVSFNLNPTEKGDYYVIGLDVGVIQPVSLVRNPSRIYLATTWNTHSATGAPVSTMPSRARESLKTLLDRFLNAYLAVNPKK